MPTAEQITRWMRLELGAPDADTVKDFLASFNDLDEDDAFHFNDEESVEEGQIEWDARNVFRDALRHYKSKTRASFELSALFEDEAKRMGL